MGGQGSEGMRCGDFGESGVIREIRNIVQHVKIYLMVSTRICISMRLLPTHHVVDND